MWLSRLNNRHTRRVFDEMLHQKLQFGHVVISHSMSTPATYASTTAGSWYHHASAEMSATASAWIMMEVRRGMALSIDPEKTHWRPSVLCPSAFPAYAGMNRASAS